MKNEKKNFDVPFIIFIGILLVALVVTAVVMYAEGKDLPVNEPSAEPSSSPTNVPSPTSSPLPSESESPVEPTFTYSMPRTASVSLSDILSWDLTIGGSETDVVSDVTALDKLYLFGTTSSADYDMSAIGGSDLFVAVIEEDRLVDVITFGTEKDDVCLFAKPCYGTFGTTFVVFSQSAEDTIDFYLLPTKTLSPLMKSLSFSGKTSFVKAVALPDGALLAVNEKGVLRLIRVYADGSTDEIELKKEILAKDMQVLGNNAMILYSVSGKDDLTGVLTVDMAGKNGETSNIFSDKSRIPLSLTPDENGYIIPYKRVVDAKTVFGVMHLSRDLLIDFDHAVSGADYDEINVFCDIGATKLKGYHFFCTKKTATGYKTTYENICTHGDLNDFSGELLENVLPTKYYNSKNGVTILGNVLKEGKSNFYMAVFSNNFAKQEEYVFGGDGNDVLHFGVTTKEGDFLLIGNTTSHSGDISVSFGKADVLILSYGK